MLGASVKMSQWLFFQKAVCITIDTHSPRIQQLHENFAAVGLSHYELLLVPRSLQTSNVGVGKTSILDIFQHGQRTCGHLARDLVCHHMNVVKQLYQDGHERVLIFEDDASFDVPATLQGLPHILRWLTTHEWDIFNLGAIAFPYPFCLPVAKNVALAPHPLLAHAYALSRAGMLRLLRYWEALDARDVHADKLLALAFPRYHVANPPLCFQSEKPALFRQAMTLLPPPLRECVDAGSFREFCLRYLRLSQVLCVGLLLLLVFLIGRSVRRWRTTTNQTRPR